ncbi:glycoside hydrolase family 78 protein [Flavobacterium undicola]|uniref:glycoside hydrolase family 78 protein n=1 Tax=Flavobacterium undicola TaxID=1932779 RepID=UPI0013787DC1|nr:fibronectin type III domain-containing protein [Flavobacterium undicola]MBA0883384.1 fibronectin type III domain-containing protein [Flavobacterium undicola]
MKNFIYYTLISFLFISCSSGGDDSTDTAPIAPTLIAPANNILCIDNSVSFQWNIPVDANKNTTSYQIQIAKDSQFSQIVKSAEGTSNSQTIALEKNTAYYWRIKATDNQSLLSEYSTTFKFYTAGEAVINHLPFLPELVQPTINSVLNTTTAKLSWTAIDVDKTDILTYDVYFGTANPPTSKISENIAVTSVDVTLNPSKEYFWKVVVKDNKGGETMGQTWKFKTN